MTNFNLKQLRVFIAIVDTGSFTEAARTLYLSQSTVSSHIRALEDELGSSLFLREAKKQVSLTSDGRRLVPHARDILLRCDAIERNLCGYTDKELLIGASTVPAQSLVPSYISRFLQNYPHIGIVIRSGDSEQILKLLLDNDIQIGFVGTYFDRQALVHHLVKEDPLVMITPNTPYYAILKEKGCYGRDLLDEPLILREHGSATQAIADVYLERLGRRIGSRPAAVRASSPECVKELVRLGCGVSIVSALSVRDQVGSGQLLQFNLEEQPVTRKIYMVCRKNGSHSELVRRFIEQVAATSEAM